MYHQLFVALRMFVKEINLFAIYTEVVEVLNKLPILDGITQISAVIFHLVENAIRIFVYY